MVVAVQVQRSARGREVQEHARHHVPAPHRDVHRQTVANGPRRTQHDLLDLFGGQPDGRGDAALRLDEPFVVTDGRAVREDAVLDDEGSERLLAGFRRPVGDAALGDSAQSCADVVDEFGDREGLRPGGACGPAGLVVGGQERHRERPLGTGLRVADERGVPAVHRDVADLGLADGGEPLGHPLPPGDGGAGLLGERVAGHGGAQQLVDVPVVVHDRHVGEHHRPDRRQDGRYPAQVGAEQPAGEARHGQRRDEGSEVEGEQRHHPGRDGAGHQRPAAGLVVAAGGQARLGAGASSGRQEQCDVQQPQRCEQRHDGERPRQAQIALVTQFLCGQAVACHRHQVDIGRGGNGTGLVGQNLFHHPVGEAFVHVGRGAQIAGDITRCAPDRHAYLWGRHAEPSLSSPGRCRPVGGDGPRGAGAGWPGGQQREQCADRQAEDEGRERQVLQQGACG